MTFLIVANQNDLNLKISWAEKLIKSYQNSTAIVTLIATKEMNLKPLATPSVRIIHYPANRNIDIHLLLIQTAKLLKNTQLCYIHHQPTTSLPFSPPSAHNCYGLLTHNNHVDGFYLDCNKLLNTMKTDINTINLIRHAMLAAGLN